jgi:hypothetical protein
MKNCLCEVHIHNQETAYVFSQFLPVNSTNNVKNNMKSNFLLDRRKLLL